MDEYLLLITSVVLRVSSNPYYNDNGTSKNCFFFVMLIFQNPYLQQ